MKSLHLGDFYRKRRHQRGSEKLNIFGFFDFLKFLFIAGKQYIKAAGN